MQDNQHNRPEKGSVTILAALAAISLLGFAAMAIDVGYATATRTQLQNVADAGSMSGARELARIYDEKGNFDYTKYTLTSNDKARILANINQFTMLNKAGGVAVGVPAGDVVYGRWDNATGEVIETNTGVDAIWLRSRRDDTANGALPALLATALGVDTFNISAQAGTAGVSATKAVPPGWGDVPVGISKAWFSAHDSPCGTDSAVRFYPTGSTLGCAGWHVFTEPTASASALRDILKGLKNGTYQAPAITADETYFNFTGGTVAADFSDFKNLYDAKKGPDGRWLVHIPVYDYDDCSNPKGEIKIIGLATARVYNVNSGQKIIDANVECDVAPIGEGGGLNFGTATGVQQMIVR
ncbi:MAG TPA: Tad domain-containing protein [Candidatus Binatia bacterium]|nr:Tad domain-containing protein [Candidatus Binatia bacterium]